MLALPRRRVMLSRSISFEFACTKIGSSGCAKNKTGSIGLEKGGGTADRKNVQVAPNSPTAAVPPRFFAVCSGKWNSFEAEP